MVNLKMMVRCSQITFLSVATSVGRAGGVGRIVGQVSIRHVRVGGGGVQVIGGSGGRRGGMIVSREASHARAFLDDRAIS